MDLFGIEITPKRLAFFAIFAVLSLALYQVKFSDIMGVPSQNFTLFQLMGPMAAGVLGPVLGGKTQVLVQPVADVVPVRLAVAMVLARLRKQGRMPE